MPFLSRLLPLALVTAIACAQPAAPLSGSCPPPEAKVSIGQRLPDCSFAGVGDRPGIALADLRGTPTIINFWASWCAACIAEMPDFDEVHTDLGRSVAIVGLNTVGLQGETRGAGETFAQRTGVSYPLAFDDGATFYTYFGNAVRPIMPTTVFADADGIVRQLWFGQLTEEKLRELIEEHLGVA